MKAFECDYCGNLLFFENISCLRCGHTLGFIHDLIDLCAVEPIEKNLWRPLVPSAATRPYRQCQNTTEHNICNWMVPANDENALCQSCRLNLVIPDLTVPGNLERWQKLETAKRRVMYSVLRYRLPTEAVEGRDPLRFKFMGDPPGGPRIMTGHAQGIITINIAEADDPERERRRVELHEPFRTLLGHIRHEIAHYYWDRLIANTPQLDRFRELFGDDRQNYSDCLKKHYASGPPPNWQLNYVTAYATCHPWEDWAETWAHYLHMSDTIETAGSFGVSLRPRHPQAATMRAEPKRIKDWSDFDGIIRQWIPLTHALNELNRGMGLPDLYPFTLSDVAVAKLRFVHEVLCASANKDT